MSKFKKKKSCLCEQMRKEKVRDVKLKEFKYDKYKGKYAKFCNICGTKNENESMSPRDCFCLNCGQNLEIVYLMSKNGHKLYKKPIPKLLATLCKQMEMKLNQSLSSSVSDKSDILDW